MNAIETLSPEISVHNSTCAVRAWDFSTSVEMTMKREDSLTEADRETFGHRPVHLNPLYPKIFHGRMHKKVYNNKSMEP